MAPAQCRAQTGIEGEAHRPDDPRQEQRREISRGTRAQVDFRRRNFGLPWLPRNAGLRSALKAKPTDLTILARNNGGRFPAEHVRKSISGDEISVSHGSREMPV